MSRLKLFARNLRFLFTHEIAALVQEQKSVDERMHALTESTAARNDAYEAAIDARLEERFTALDTRLDTRETALDQRLEARELALDQRLDERFVQLEQRNDERQAEIETHNDQRHAEFEVRLERRNDERQAALERRNDERMEQFSTQFHKHLDDRFDERNRLLDARFDDRVSRSDRYIDERFHALEQRTDERMEAHERKVDHTLHNNAQGIVERTDIMLQIFEQRLDKQRRDLRALSETPVQPVAEAVKATPDIAAQNGHQTLDESSPLGQLISFRKLAAGEQQTPAKLADSETPLYHQILAWKKIAHEGLDKFTPDEQETADYILSFISDPKELHYVKQHLRRFVSTLQRIPPAQSTGDRLLELGSLSHLAPAIKKYCGYGEISCADVWDAEEKIVQETVKQKRGSDNYTFELRNFNVERDRFPYPDGHFYTVLCCELIEHLQRDPMHMLWECNRVLQPEGFLLLTTPNIASCRALEGLLVGCAPYLLAQYNVRDIADQHQREYAPYEIGIALAAAGFTIVELETEDVWLRSNPAIIELLKKVQITTELRGDNIFALACKTSAPIERYPKELYID